MFYKLCRFAGKSYDEHMQTNTPQPIRRLQIRSLHGRGRKRTNADAWLTALETRYAENMSRTGQYVRAMAHEPDNDGRGQPTPAPDAVNGTEVRGSERWLGTPDPTKDYGCYTVLPDGTRQAFNPPQADETRKPTRKPARKLTASDRIRQAGILPTQADFD